MDKSKTVFLVASVVFALTTILGLVGYLSTSTEVEKYKTESDTIVSQAVGAAKLTQKEEDTAHFFEEAKKPYAEYVGPSDFGSIRFNYPKTWSVYNSQLSQTGYEVVFYPGIVPTVSDTTVMSLRLAVVGKQYETALSEYEALVAKGQLRATVVNVGQTDDFAGYEGIRFDGAINETLLEGTIVILKLRDKTILIRSDAAQFALDFDDIILPSFRYLE
ncbi:MAG: hypothetical protein LBU20_02115 [Candidatus Nomurabacteria bacterium]|jgi:hypothetical protein|nr:hypothetical protein [Candidatus Nomurabacteria bacterium]